MKKGIFLIVLVSIVAIYIYTKQEPKRAIAVTVEKNETEPLPRDQNTTVVKKSQIKKPIVHKPSQSNEQNETNETSPSKMCLVGLKKKYFSFESYTFDEFGHVKTVTADKNQDGQPETKTFFSYDDRGNLVKKVTKMYQEEITKTPDAVENYPYKDYQDISPEVVATEIMSYDENNHLIDKISEKNSVTIQYHYDYDEQGNVNYKFIYMNDELMYEVKVINRYDQENHLLSVEHKFLQSNAKLLFINGEFADYEYQYNKKGQLIKKIDPRYARVFEYSYDELGHLVKKDENRYSTTKYKKLVMRDSYYHKYDKLGRLIQIDRYKYSVHNPNKNLNYSDSNYYKYDKYGNLIEESNSDGSILLKQKFERCK